MAEPVEGLPGGTPRSPLSGDIERTANAALARARQVFLAGCSLPAAWAGQPQWRILETGFGLGLNFLAAWRAWKDDPQRPGLLHFVAIAPRPAAVGDLLRAAAASPELAPLAQQLAAQWRGLLPGTHRLSFEAGHVLLTLHVGELPRVLREEPCTADSIFLDGLHPSAAASADTLRALSRHARHGAGFATGGGSGALRRSLAGCGFVVEAIEGSAPGHEGLQGRYAPAWQVPAHAAAREASQAVVVGAGLAGASVAAALARRGWRVTVLDAALAPAAGASGLPAGLFAPHQSPDDSALSRLTRCGLRLTWQALQPLARGTDWEASGVLERDGRLPRERSDPGWDDWTRAASDAEAQAAGLPAGAPATWHALAGWARPGALVEHWLARPGIRFQGSARVQSLEAGPQGWSLRNAEGRLLAEAPLVVVAAALGSAALLAAGTQGDAPATRLPLQPVRGQVSWGLHPPAPSTVLPAVPVHGNGHLVPQAPSPEGPAWYCGATFGRGETALDERAQDHTANLQRLRDLLPAAGDALAPQFQDGSVRSWTGVRCASADRRPLVGEAAPGLWVSCAMGSRGLSFALLCAELLAARLHAEPLPLPARLACALDLGRLSRPRAGT